MTMRAEVGLEVDIARELAFQQEICESNKQLTEFDATPPLYVQSIGRGQWPKPDPREIRLPAAFYQSKGLLSSRAHVMRKPAEKKPLGRGRVLSSYASSRPGHAASSMTEGTITTARSDLVPPDLEDGKAALMQRFLGADNGSRTDYSKPGEGSLVFSGGGSVHTVPEARESWPSLDTQAAAPPIKSSSSDVGIYKKPSQKFRKAVQREERNQGEAYNPADMDPDLDGMVTTTVSVTKSLTDTRGN